MKYLIKLFDSIALILLDSYLKIAGYKTVIATTDKQKEMAYKLRWKVFNDEGYFSKEFNEQTYSDICDNHSAQFLVFKDSELVGAIRLIIDITKGMGLTGDFNIKIDTNKYSGNIVEIGRFVVNKSHRVKSRLVTLALVRAAHRYSYENNINWWIGCASEALLKSFSKFVKYERFIEYELTSEQETSRKEFAGYFNHRIIPFIMNVKEISPYKGLSAQWKNGLKKDK